MAVSPKQWTFDFTAKVRGTAWEIRVSPGPGQTAKDIRIAEFVAACDGETLYGISDFGINEGEGVVFPKAVPNHDPFFAPIWLAFGAGSYFAELATNRIAVPICENVFSGESIRNLVALEYSQEAFWVLSPEPPRCPQVLYSLDDGRIKRVRGLHYQVTEERLPPPYDQGFTNIVFEADDYETVGRFRLPRTAVLRVYWLRGGPTCIHELRMRREGVRLSDRPIPFPPQLPGVAAVSDWRFTLSNRPMLMPYVTSNRFLTLEELQAHTSYVSDMTRSWQLTMAHDPLRPAGPGYATSRTQWFWPGAGVVTILFASLFWALKRGNSRTRETTTGGK